jgi:hypothetical protein
MNTSLLAFSDQVTVAFAVLLFVGVILITSIIRYGVDDFVKFWAAVGTVMGLALGGVGTFFFTKDQVEQKDSQLKVTQQALKISESEKANVATQLAQYTNLKDWITLDPTQSVRVQGWTDKWHVPKLHITTDAQTPTPVSPVPSIQASASPAPSASVSPRD